MHAQIFLKKNDSLLKFKLSSGNLTLKRSIKGKEIIKSNKSVLKKEIFESPFLYNK